MKTSLFLLFLFLTAKIALADADFVNLPPAPPDYISDEEPLLSAELKEELIASIKRYRSLSEIGIWVAVYPETPPQGGEVFAKTLLESWNDNSRDSAIVLFIPNDSRSPYGAASGELAELWGAEKSSAMVEDAMMRARARAGSERQMRAAVAGLYHDIRFLRENYNRQLEEAMKRGKEAYNETQREKVYLRGAIGLGVIALLALVFFFMLRNKKKRSAKKEMIFPPVNVQKRFQAPYSGGAGIVRSASVRRQRR